MDITKELQELNEKIESQRGVLSVLEQKKADLEYQHSSLLCNGYSYLIDMEGNRSKQLTEVFATKDLLNIPGGMKNAVENVIEILIKPEGNGDARSFHIRRKEGLKLYKLLRGTFNLYKHQL